MIKYINIILIFILFSITVQAQNFGSIELSKDTVFIGDPVYLDLKIIKKGALNRVDFSAFQQIKALNDTTVADVSLESFGNWIVNQEMEVDLGSIQWTKNEKGDEQAQTQIKIVFWDNGIYYIPSLKMDNAIKLESPRITVLAPQEVEQTLADSTVVLKPIKSILREHRNIWDYLPFILGIIGILGMYFLIQYLIKRKKPVTEKEVIVPVIPAHEIALSALINLDKKQLWQNGKIKAYQSELTHIIRAYLGKRYNINALENTTEEVIRLLDKTNFDKNLQSQVSNILQMADMIKFAKAKPSDDIHQQFWNQAKELVLKTKPSITINESEN